MKMLLEKNTVGLSLHFVSDHFVVAEQERSVTAGDLKMLARAFLAITRNAADNDLVLGSFLIDELKRAEELKRLEAEAMGA